MKDEDIRASGIFCFGLPIRVIPKVLANKVGLRRGVSELS